MTRSASSDSLNAIAICAYSGEVFGASTSPNRRYTCASVRPRPPPFVLPALDFGIPASLATADHSASKSNANGVPDVDRRTYPDPAVTHFDHPHLEPPIERIVALGY